jgi:hypothetical protein
MPSKPSIRRAVLVVAMLCASIVAGAAPALSQTNDDRGGADEEQIVLSGDLVVPSGRSVSTALSFNGDATIDGTVTESVIVFNGGATITGTVRQDVIVFNGPVVIEPGARVGGDIISRQTPQVADGADVQGEITGVAARFDWEDVGLAGRFAWWLGYSISTLILGLLLLLFAPGSDRALSETRRRLGASIGTGLAVFFLTPIVAIILMVTIVGLPLGLFLLLALALLYTVGYVSGAHAIGRFIVKQPSSRYVAFLVGWGIVRVLGLVPILGGLTWTLVTVFGLGALVVATRRGGRREATAVAAPPPAPPFPDPA